MFSLSTLKQKVADFFKTDLPVLAFQIRTPVINEIPNPSGKYIDFLMEIVAYAGNRGVIADVHFVYQKTTRERHLRCAVFERTVIVVLRAKEYSELEKVFDYAQKTCVEFQFFPADRLFQLKDDADRTMSALDIKTTLTEELDNSIDLFARVGQFPVYIRSFCAVLIPDSDWKVVEHYIGITTAGTLKDNNYISEPSVKFLSNISSNNKLSVPNTVIGFDELREFFEKEYFYHTVFPGRTHVFSGIEGHYSEFLNIDRLGEYAHIGVVLESTSENKSKAIIQEKLEHNLYRTSPGFVEFFLKSTSATAEILPINEFAEVKPINEFSCTVPVETKQSYPDFCSKILHDLSTKPLSHMDQMVLSNLVYKVPLDVLLNCLEVCLSYEKNISKETLIQNLPSEFQHLLSDLSDEYEVSCSVVNELLNTNFSTLTSYFDNSKEGAFVLVNFEQIKTFNFMLNHLCAIDRPTYKGNSFYVHIPVDLIIHLDLRVIRQFRKLGINFVAYGSSEDWLELQKTNNDMYHFFKYFFINCNVFKKNDFDECFLQYRRFEPDKLNRLKKFGPDYYYVQSEGPFQIKECLIKI